MGSGSAQAITSQGPLRVPSPLHLTWSCLLPEKGLNPGLFSHFEAPLASKQESGTERGIYSAVVNTKTFGRYAWKQWLRQPSVLTKFIWKSEQVLAAVWFSTGALLDYSSWEFVLWGSPDIVPSLCSWSLPARTLGLPWTTNWSSKRTLEFAGLFPPVLISEGHNFSLVMCPGKCSPLSRRLIFLDGWFVKQMQSKLFPFFPGQSGLHSSLSIL